MTCLLHSYRARAERAWASKIFLDRRIRDPKIDAVRPPDPIGFPLVRSIRSSAVTRSSSPSS